jgi:uncharacterized membrane protein
VDLQGSNRRARISAANAWKGKHSLEFKLTDVKRIPPRRRGLTVVALALSVLVIILFIEIPPSTLLGKADFVGYAICHRIPERSFVLGDRHFPLCARCTGTFLGAVLGLVAMLVLRRHPASRLPSAPILGILVLFVGFWGFDGLNSYMTFFPGAPHLYTPQNWLRLTTGTLNGLALILIVFPIFNFTLWRNPVAEPVIKSFRELGVILVAAVLLILMILQARVSFILYPLAILSSLGVVMMLTLINTIVAAVVLGREGYAQAWWQALPPITVGLALAILEMTGMVLLRAYLTTTFGLPI